ncbi:MAG: prepilin-type N-terminal cleavage/methylation domain-containing protein [Candidatus Krumholzibacteriia bacterium]
MTSPRPPEGTLARLHRWLRSGGRDGFTLTELLVVLVILTIGILPLAMVQHRARQQVGQADRHTQAVTVAQDQLERMKGRGFGNAVPDSGAAGPISWQSQVTTVSQGLEQLQVTVTWAEVSGTRSLTVADLVSVR